jgi:dihydrofolate reductase
MEALIGYRKLQSKPVDKIYGYHEFYDSVHVLAIGRKTYEQILGFGNWPYPGKPSYIFNRKHL